MSITHLTSLPQLNGILSKSPTKLSVIDFHAQWCGPCHAIAPHFESLAKQYPNVNFIKCDVDAARDVASQYGVSAMPTFIFLKGSTKVDQVRGANKAGLSSTVEKHASGSTGAFSGKGQTLGGTAPAEAPAIPTPFANMDPQLKVFLFLVVGYLVFWYLS